MRRKRLPYIPSDLRPIKIHRLKKAGLGEYDSDQTPLKDIGNDYRTDSLPIDLATRLFYVRKNRLLEQGQPTLKDKDSLLQFIAQNTNYIASTKILRRGFIARNVAVGTTAVRIIQAQFLRGYIISNPSSTLADVVYVGNNGVATGSGFPLFGMDKLEIYPEENCELWAIAGSSLNLRILEL